MLLLLPATKKTTAADKMIIFMRQKAKKMNAFSINVIMGKVINKLTFDTPKYHAIEYAKFMSKLRSNDKLYAKVVILANIVKQK